VGAEALEDFGGDFGAAGFQDGIEGLEPLLHFDVFEVVWLDVRLIVHDRMLPSSFC
jgi:hypothetical protein